MKNSDLLKLAESCDEMAEAVCGDAVFERLSEFGRTNLYRRLTDLSYEMRQVVSESLSA